MAHSPLKNKIVWITGASSGIGEALAYECASRGAITVITARREAELARVCGVILNRGGAALAMPGDVEDLSALKRIASSIESRFGKIDLLIANAGTHIFTKPERFDSKEYLSLMNLNFGGILHSLEAVIPGMLARENGHIVGMASLAGYRGLPRAGAYGASKAAIIHFLESIRFHLSRRGIAVSVVTPGVVKTPLTDRNDFRMPFRISAERAANVICDGIERRAKEISFPKLFSLFLKLARIVPYPLYERVVARLW